LRKLCLDHLPVLEQPIELFFWHCRHDVAARNWRMSDEVGWMTADRIRSIRLADISTGREMV
jgi:hypothetical protein